MQNNVNREDIIRCKITMVSFANIYPVCTMYTILSMLHVFSFFCFPSMNLEVVSGMAMTWVKVSKKYKKAVIEVEENFLLLFVSS